MLIALLLLAVAGLVMGWLTEPLKNGAIVLRALGYGAQRVRTALLRALTLGPAYGNELVDRVREQTGGRLELGMEIYPALRNLEREGLLESHESEPRPERGNRPAIYYVLTADGREALEKLLAAPEGGAS